MTETLAPRVSQAESEAPLKKPFVGLRPFAASEADFFFGRDDDLQIIASNLRASRLTLLYGPSGIGKSSILAAGVTHTLRDQARRNLERGRSPGFAVVVFGAWRDDPIAGLVRAVEEEVCALVGEPDSPPRGETLADVLAGWSEILDGTLLIVLDQFEEYFLYHTEQDGKGTFSVEFPLAVARRDVRADFVVSIREDAYAKLDCFEGRIPRLFDNNVRLEALTVEQARDAIRCPIEAYNSRSNRRPVEIEDKLVETILRQARPRGLGFAEAGAGDVGESDADEVSAPFLQLVLDRLWNEEQEAGSDVLRLSTFERLGETRGIVEGHLRNALATLTAEEQDVAARTFQFLVTRSGAKVAHGADDLEDFTGIPKKRIEPVLERLARGGKRILNPLAAPRGSHQPTRYELFHDVLAEAVLAWRAERVQKAEASEAREQARRAKLRARRWAAGTGAMLVFAAICLALLFVAIYSRHTADSARKVARAQQLVAESEATLSTDPDGALRKAEQALEVKPSPQAEFAFRTAVGASQLRIAIRHRLGAVLRAQYSGNGKRVMTLGTDKTVLVSDARTGHLISRIGYDTNLRTADLSRDGRYVVTAGQRDNTVTFWNATTGKRLAAFHSPDLSGAWLDPADGRRAVATDFAGGIQIWRLGARKPRVLNPPTIDALTYAAFSPDGRRIVAIGRSNDAWVLDARTGKTLRTLVGHSATIDAVAWSADSRRIVTGGNDLWWRAWDLATGSRKVVGHEETDAVTAVAFSADGSLVATVTGNQADVWDADTGEHIQKLQGHSNVITDIAFRRDGRLVLTGSSDGTARVWDVDTGTTLTELRGSGSVVESAVFSPSGRFVLTASADRTARIWDISSGLEFWPHASPVRDAVFSPNGKAIVTGGRDKQIVVSDVRTRKIVHALPNPPSGAVNSIRYSPNRKLLAVATDDPHLLIRRASNGAPIATLAENPAPVFQAVFSPNNKQIALADGDGEAGIFDARIGALRRWLRANGQGKAHPGAVNSIGWSPDGRFIVTGGSDSQVRVWNAATGGYLRTLWAHNGPVTSVAFAPDADRVVTTGADRIAYVWAVPSGKKLATLKGDPQPLYSAAFNPTGSRIVTGDSGGVVRVWDWRAQKMLAAIPAHADLVNAVSYSADGKRILSASDDWSAKIYSCWECKPLSELRYRVLKREKLIAPP
jgi:WD40 repeat protein